MTTITEVAIPANNNHAVSSSSKTDLEQPAYKTSKGKGSTTNNAGAKPANKQPGGGHPNKPKKQKVQARGTKTRAGKNASLLNAAVSEETVKRQAWSDVKDAQTKCKFYSTPKGCDMGNQCRFLHEDEETLATHNNGYKPCHQFMKTGSCKFGEKCKFSHVTPSDDGEESGSDGPFDGAANKYVPPKKEVVIVPDLEDDIFVTRVNTKPAYWYVMACLVMVTYFSRSGPEIYVTLMTLFVTVSIIISTLVHLFTYPVCFEVRARTTYVRDEIDDRPTSDRGRDVLLGKLYSLDYYFVFKYRSYMSLDGAVHSFTIRQYYQQSILWWYYGDYVQHLSDNGVYMGMHDKPELVSTSLLHELRNRKTLYATDPQFTTLAQRLDNVPLANADLDRYGVSVGNNTIKICMLQAMGMESSPFHNRHLVFTPSKGTEFMTKEYQALMRMSNPILSYLKLVVTIISQIWAALPWRAVLDFIWLVIRCIVLILVIMCLSLLVAQNVSLFGHPAHSGVCEGINAGSVNSSSSSWSNVNFSVPFHSPETTPSEAGSTEPVTGEQDPTVLADSLLSLIAQHFTKMVLVAFFAAVWTVMTQSALIVNKLFLDRSVSTESLLPKGGWMDDFFDRIPKLGPSPTAVQSQSQDVKYSHQWRRVYLAAQAASPVILISLLAVLILAIRSLTL